MKITNKIKKYINNPGLFFQKVFTYLFYFSGMGIAPLPRSMNVEITWNCNLNNCFMCPKIRAQAFKVENRNMSLAEFKEIVNKVPSCKHINIVGDGEPFVSPDFFAMLKFCESKGITNSFNTNGILLTEKNILNLPKTVNLIWISIDSPVKETYEFIRKGSNFDNLIRNIETLHRLRKDIEINFQPVTMKINMAEMPQMIDIAKKVSASINFVNLIAFDEELDKQHVHHYPKEYGEIVKKIQAEAQKKGVKVFTRPVSPEKRSCTEPWFSPTLSIAGDVYPCNYVYEGRGDVTFFKEYYLGQPLVVPEGQYDMGNIFKQSFSKIWNGKDYRLLRKEVIKTNNPRSISSLDLKQMRGKANLKEKYSYCAMCSFRWSCTC